MPKLKPSSHFSPGIDNDIYSTVDACPNACEMWKAIERMARFVDSVKQSQKLKTVAITKTFTIIKTILLKTLNIPPPDHNNLPETEEKQLTPNNLPSPYFYLLLSTYDPESCSVTKDEEMSKEKGRVEKLMALISLSFKKIYKPTNNNLRTSSNTSRANQDNSPRINRGTGNDTDDESEEKELEAHYMYMAQIQEVTPDSVDNSGPIFDRSRSEVAFDLLRDALSAIFGLSEPQRRINRHGCQDASVTRPGTLIPLRPNLGVLHEPITTPVLEPIVAPVVAPVPNTKPTFFSSLTLRGVIMKEL
ncbi:hypothetical protein Tco_1164075 [Tanacetum coccineum]